MAPTESLSLTTSIERRDDQGQPMTPCSIVWLRGEHDVATVTDLSDTLAAVIALDEADVVIDLRDVGFMGAATISVLLRARKLLGLRSRTLTLRAPSAAALRILDACGLAGVFDLARDEPGESGGALALRSWVSVPATGTPRQGVAHPGPVIPPITDAFAVSQDAAAAREGP